MRALAFVLVAIGLLLVARAIPPGMAKKVATSTTTVATALVVVLVTAVLTLVTRDEPTKPGPARADRVGVCAEPSVQPRCTELYESVTAVLDVLAAAPLDAGAVRSKPALVVPGRGDLYLIQSQVTTAPPAQIETDLRTALVGNGWVVSTGPAELLRFQRGALVADLRITPAGAGSRVELTVNRSG